MVTIRTLATTYTQNLDQVDQFTLRREIRIKSKISDAAAFSEKSGSDEISTQPSTLELPTIPANIMALVISRLDKFVAKRRSLHRMSRKAHKQRHHLSRELWKLLRLKFDELGVSNTDLRALKNQWDWKCFPYARVAVKDSLDSDPTFRALATYEDKADEETKQLLDFNRFIGNWRDAHMKKIGNKLDYEAIAKSMMDHIFKQEIRIDTGKPKKKQQTKEVTGKGSAQVRAENLKNSAHDPRIPPKHPPKAISKKVAEFYFCKGDLAKSMFEEIIAVRDDEGPIRPKWFGERIHTHFGALKFERGVSGPDRFNCHNQIRNFYADLARSERFKTAVQHNREDLQKIVPANQETLLRILEAKRKNSERSRLIRLGRLMLHASDVPADTKNRNELFQERMDFFATSFGQSEIKRSETFGRVFRNAVGLSAQTLKNLFNQKQNISDREHDLLGSFRASKAAAGCDLAGNELSTHLATFENRLSIVFGEKGAINDGVSRSSLFVSSNEKEQVNIALALIRLAAEVRNRSNHFYTMRRISDLITGGILKEAASSDGTPGPGEAVSEALSAFSKLFEHDKQLLVESTKERLTAHQANWFLDKRQLEQIALILNNLVIPTTPDLPTRPRFISVLNRVRDLSHNPAPPLPEALTPLAELNLATEGITTNSPNKTKIGLLRMIYEVGFDNWLSDHLTSTDKKITTILETMASYRLERAKNTHQQKKRHYAITSTLIEKLGLTTDTTLEELLRELTAEGARHEELDRAYDPHPKRQQKVTDELAGFKQELFAHLFIQYLKDEKLDWIFGVSSEIPIDKQVNIDDLKLVVTDGIGDEMWKAQFYTWLYLIPPEEVSFLRHQLRKTLVLRNKAKIENATKLAEFSGPSKISVESAFAGFDALTGLFARVHDAGFVGNEQNSALSGAEVFYENDKLFDKLQDIDADLNGFSFPGLRRGLRQIVRFGHLEFLKPVFESHRVTNRELKTLQQAIESAKEETSNEATSSNYDFKRLEKRKEIIAKKKEMPRSNRDREKKQKDLKQLVCEYRELTAKLALYRFSINAARLSDHVRLYRLMMRIIGRLADYTLLWERDRLFMYYGIIYLQCEGKVEFDINSAPSEGGTAKNEDISHGILKVSIGEETKTLKMWNEEKGFLQVKHDPLQVKNRGPIAEYWRQFNNYFVKPDYPDQQHPSDQKHQEEIAKDPNKPQTISDLHPKPGSGKGRAQIRTDFAHYNMLNVNHKVMNGGRSIWDRKASKDFSYYVNVVRSLFGYDRKLKNAVSQSIIEILEKDGLLLDWELKNDRLQPAYIQPMIEVHLEMLPTRPEHAIPDAPFAMPRTSPRFASMAQGLFAPSKKGYGNGGQHFRASDRDNWRDNNCPI